MSEHYCKNCKKSNGNNTCSLTGALHTTGIECPSFGQKESEMFKAGDRVRVIADEERLTSIGFGNMKVLEAEGTVIRNTLGGSIPIKVSFDKHDGEWGLAEQDLELIEEEVKEPHGGEPEHDPADGQPIRTFDTGATRDTDQGKLDYLKALSPIVLRRYVQYLDKHRKQSDGSYRDFDNWKKGIPLEAYISGSGRHFIDTWLLTEGYATEDNHGPVEIEDAICAQLFNLMGRLHEMLGKKIDRTKSVAGGY